MSRQLRQADISAMGKKSSHAGKGLISGSRHASKKTGRRLKLTSRTVAAYTPFMDDSNEENNSDVAEEDEQTTDVDDEDEIAPSGRSNRKRGHQTGLSVSLSNTSINTGIRKRTWSNRVQEEDEMKRPDKLSKMETESSEDDSDEEDDSDAGYEGVELISDSEDEDPEGDEEKWIIQSEEDNDDEDTARPGSSSSTSSSNSWEGFADDAPAPENKFFAEHFNRTTNAGTTTTKSPRKVRFVDEVAGAESSSAESTDTEDQFWPDLFLQQDQLDPAFRAQLEKDKDYDSESSYWDLEGLGEYALEPEDDEDDEDDDGESSGYESDDGETTDEEILPPPTIRPQSSQHSTAKSPSRTPQRPIRRTITTPGSSARRQGPPLATWVIDSAKPTYVVDKITNKMIMYQVPQPQSRPQSADGSNEISANNSPTRTMMTSGGSQTNGNDDAKQDMLVKSPANLMMSGFMANGVGDGKLPTSNILKVDNDDDVFDDDDENDDDDSDPEAHLNLSDFIDFGDSSDSNDEGAEEETGETDGPINGRPSFRTAAAFRSNQMRVQRRQMHRSFKADAVVKSGHLDSASKPITPVRRLGPRSSFSQAASKNIGLTSKQ